VGQSDSEYKPEFEEGYRFGTGHAGESGYVSGIAGGSGVCVGQATWRGKMKLLSFLQGCDIWTWWWSDGDEDEDC
jgi:hypothetical protein